MELNAKNPKNIQLKCQTPLQKTKLMYNFVPSPEIISLNVIDSVNLSLTTVFFRLFVFLRVLCALIGTNAYQTGNYRKTTGYISKICLATKKWRTFYDDWRFYPWLFRTISGIKLQQGMHLIWLIQNSNIKNENAMFILVLITR